MANYLKVSTISAAEIDTAGLHGQAAVDRMLEFWQKKLNAVLPDKPELIVLPEACDRFNDLRGEKLREYYMVRGNQLRDVMSDIARQHGCTIAYSAVRQMADNSWRNSTQIIDNRGAVCGIYDKNHPVVAEITQSQVLAGSSAPIFNCDFGRVACAICFDLNFDELRLQYAKAQPDLILFSSMYHGGLMQQYWAYSCRSFFIGAIAGLPGTVIAPNGRILAETTNYFDHVTTVINLDSRLVHLDENWDKIIQLKERYGSDFRMDDTGYLGAVLISSETGEVSIDEMIAEVGIELLDDYMQRSLAVQQNPDNQAP